MLLRKIFLCIWVVIKSETTSLKILLQPRHFDHASLIMENATGHLLHFANDGYRLFGSKGEADSPLCGHATPLEASQII